MANKYLLTKGQEDFIKKYKISEELLIDAHGEGMSPELIHTMIEEKKVLACNTRVCSENESHNFQTMEGECPQCDPTRITAVLREYKDGYIYIAGSKKGGLLKVGSSNETKDRVKTLNFSNSKYAGYDDWELLYQAKTNTVGRVERIFQQKLIEYKASYPQEKVVKSQNAAEFYRCSYTKAKDAITVSVEEAPFEFTHINEKKHIIAEYQFKNLKMKSEDAAVVINL